MMLINDLFLLNMQPAIYFPAILDPPKVTISPQDYNVTLNGTITLNCNASGLPRPKIIWFKNGQLLSLTTDDPSSLTLSGVSVRDEGRYHCQFTNIVGSALSHTSTIRVYWNKY